ncbi:type II toxin-antitoxin system Phd/YefM family antitoxin [Paenarthrobacter sp. NPDC090517]|uniref:type II toxin-antitoxin system Phd/YefM family antitoxin n=1 Tax=Paenarthrobacter sp. NPDC090517 TaxID=3364381 RepID=UPI00381B64FD
MTTIPHRELRNQSSKILERVKNGEVIDVTNNGEVAATLIPPRLHPLSVYSKQAASGRQARHQWTSQSCPASAAT